MYLPKKLRLVEVCPRDGFQNVAAFIPTERKVLIAKRLLDSGFKDIDLTSFVSPKAIPQMADAAEVMAEVLPYAHARGAVVTALALNRRGVENAIAAYADAVTFVISVSELHNKANSNRTTDESMAQFADLMLLPHDGIKVKVGLATSFGSPFGDKVPVERTVSMAERLLALGADEIILADTVGKADPLQTEQLLTAVRTALPQEQITLHLHDTGGFALANILTALQMGFTSFETAAGGLGGCPFAPGAAGNTATEDAVRMFHAMYINTGISEDILLDSVRLIQRYVDTPLHSRQAVLHDQAECCMN